MADTAARATPIVEDAHVEDAEEATVPHTLVISRGKVGPHAAELVDDLRRMMQPNTATKLRQRRWNTMRDFTHVAPSLGVSHILAVSQGAKTGEPQLAIARSPRGPTLQFRVSRYALSSQLRKALRKSQVASLESFRTAPLVVLNNFQGENRPRYLKTVELTFHAMFPSIDVSSVKLRECKRVLLVHFDENTEEILVRHYFIRAEPQGASRPVKRLLRSHIPNLENVTDVSEVIENAAGFDGASDSEAEDPAASVALPARFGGKAQGNKRGKTSVVKLRELGPRVSLQLVKVLAGVFEGEVQYHRFQTRTEEQVEEQRERMEDNARKAEERRTQQAANVERKRQQEEERVAKKREKIERRKAKLQGVLEEYKGATAAAADGKKEQNEEGDDDDDEEEEEEESESESDNKGETEASTSKRVDNKSKQGVAKKVKMTVHKKRVEQE